MGSEMEVCGPWNHSIFVLNVGKYVARNPVNIYTEKNLQLQWLYCGKRVYYLLYKIWLLWFILHWEKVIINAMDALLVILRL